MTARFSSPRRPLKAAWDSEQSVNLCEAWTQATGLPMVFGVWAVRETVRLPDLNFYFKSSLRYGLASLGRFEPRGQR